MTTINIPYRECKIMYDVDQKSISQMAEHFGIEWSEMKSALRQYGFTIRNKEPKPAVAPKNYTIVLVDTEKIVEPVAATATTVVTVSNN